MKYLKQYRGTETVSEVTYEDALWTMLSTYKDNETTRELLRTPGTYPGMFASITVEA